LVDIYPTLADLCRLTNPPPPAGLSGTSLAAILDDPLHPGKDEAITYWEPASSLRTDRHRLIYYHDNAVAELFDHATDPWEVTNVAGQAGNEAVVSNLVAASISNAPALRVAPDHYRTWVTNRFAPAACSDSNTVGRLRDPDGDGLPNVFEYFHGTSPTSFTTSVVLAPAVVETGGVTCLGVRFTRSLEATDLRALARARAALTAPSGDAVDPDDLRYRVGRTVTGTVETLTLRDPRPGADAPQRFIHLELDWQE
jgi:hypothetical protein